MTRRKIREDLSGLINQSYATISPRVKIVQMETLVKKPIIGLKSSTTLINIRLSSVSPILKIPMTANMGNFAHLLIQSLRYQLN